MKAFSHGGQDTKQISTAMALCNSEAIFRQAVSALADCQGLSDKDIQILILAASTSQSMAATRHGIARETVCRLCNEHRVIYDKLLTVRDSIFLSQAKTVLSATVAELSRFYGSTAGVIRTHREAADATSAMTKLASVVRTVLDTPADSKPSSLIDYTPEANIIDGVIEDLKQLPPVSSAPVSTVSAPVSAEVPPPVPPVAPNSGA